ncbi:DUF1631 family protein [Ramlibacter alkalitolerans]|uniref:DUF1631 family protein n=1 Tax=Ramlibacter alkalitolerans TaxID=2039631 RepID=A0ABS1JJ49_9BURK|nr:DUF1631 family protein [Ramlibacter alkalitolerans]MBL0424250.1 DUF1631 family protein [Ramlibacter alkalitolerans]
MSGSPQPHYQTLYRACIKDTASQGAELMRSTLARALHALPQAAAGLEDVVERGLLQDAVEVLRERQQTLIDAFPQALLTEFAHAIAGDRGSWLSFESLALLGDEQMQDNADLVRACGALEEAVRPELLELENTLVSAQLTPEGAAQRHPLRPEVYVRSVHRLARHSPVSPAVRRRWVRHLPLLMAPELARTYAAMAQRLRPQDAASTPQPPARQEDVDRATQLTIRELRKLMEGDPADGAARARRAGAVFAETEFSQTVPAALQMVQDMRKVDQLVLQLRQRQAAMPGTERDSLEAFREALRREAKQPAQALGLEVVHLMIANLAADPRLLPPVRALVREIEPPLLRLALADPRFFSDRSHPARRLLQEITQHSLAWSSPQEPGFPAFMDSLQQATDALLDARANGPEAFEIALLALQDAWDEAQPRGRRNRERAVRALIRAEQRNLLAERVGRELLKRREALGAPAEALAFLTGPWAHVLAQARLTDLAAQEDPGGYGWVATTVLWSVQASLAGHVANQQVQMVQRIRQGLASIDYLPADTQRWLHLLAALRDLALSATPASAERIARERGPERVSTWLAPLEMHESGYVPDTPMPLAAGNTPEPDTLPVQDLAVGSYVDLLAGGWERWQLTWASPHGLLFMFTNAAGATRSMTRRKLDQMLSQGAVRLVSAHPVVDGALDAVARAAWRNSL